MCSKHGAPLLSPPASDIPTAAAPDAAAQKAMLDKTADYVSKNYGAIAGVVSNKNHYPFPGQRGSGSAKFRNAR